MNHEKNCAEIPTLQTRELSKIANPQEGEFKNFAKVAIFFGFPIDFPLLIQGSHDKKNKPDPTF